MIRVYLEQGRTWTFACAIDWPGWARRGKGDEAALEELQAYSDRYAAVVADFRPGDLEVVATVPGNGTTDFGAPDTRGPWDQDSVDIAPLVDRLEACWTAFDRTVAVASEQLRKGPRGGGRNRDDIARHVQEAERQYARKLGAKIPPRTPWDQQRRALTDAMRDGASDPAWPVAYGIRRIGWHLLDHAWEIEDKDPASCA